MRKKMRTPKKTVLRKPRANSRARKTSTTRSMPRVQWNGFRPLFDFWGNEIKRFYKLDTLAGATEWVLRKKKDRFLIRSIQDVLGPTPVVSLSFELFQEGKYQLIFRLRAANVKRKQASFAFVVAKAHGNYSEMALKEHENLRVLNERIPSLVVKPFRGGYIFLPDRHQRSAHGREIYVYLTQWLGGFHELGVARNLQFFINIKDPHLFSLKQTEAMKARMAGIIARSYDAVQKNCMDIPQIASGDFVVTKSTKETPKLKLIACRRMLQHVNPAKLIHRIAEAHWEWGGREFRLAPADPGALFASLAEARGNEEARAWFSQYIAAVRRGTFPPQETLPIEDLEALIRG